MDHMDLDQVLEVPDTPDRLTTRSTTERNGPGQLNSSLMFGRLGQGSRCSDKAQIHPPRGSSRSGKSGHHGNSIVLSSGESSSSRNHHILRRNVDEKQDPNHLSNMQRKKSLFTSLPFASRDSAFVDLTERNRHAPVNKTFPSGAARVTRDAIEGRHFDHADKVESTLGFVEQVNNNTNNNDNAAQPNARKKDSGTLNSISMPRGTRQRRLVRNGCISPINIEKGKQPIERDNSGSTSAGQSDSVPVTSNASTSRIDVRDIVAEDHNSHSLKGKGLLNLPFSMDVRSKNKPSRNSLSINEKASESGVASGDGVRNFKESAGWRSTHSQSRNHNSPVLREGQHISIEDGGSSFVSHCNGNRGRRRENEPHGRTMYYNSNGQMSDTSARLGKNKGSDTAKETVAKRQKLGSASSSLAECSRSTADNLDVIGSSRQTTKARLNESKNHNGVGITESSIDIDEATPSAQVHNVRSHGSNVDATPTQLELDEMLARELQEQFYNEQTAVGSGEIDAHIAMALQQQEESHRTVSRRRQPVPNPRGRSSQNIPRSRAQAPSAIRLASLRNRFPGQPRTISSSSRGRNSTTVSSRQRNSVFPADMDVDMRMHILEALESLESFHDVGVGTSFAQMHRDFNENDYEMLLALDENNHRHAGAATRHINGLPESTVQNDNLEEACAICLDNPTVGEVIRHLPCLHKFHKDCIDPWLRRRSSCPVCKSSIN